MLIATFTKHKKYDKITISDNKIKTLIREGNLNEKRYN